MNITIDTRNFKNILNTISKFNFNELNKETNDLLFIDVIKDYIYLKKSNLDFGFQFKLKIKNNSNDESLIISNPTLSGVINSIIDNELSLEKKSNNIFINTKTSKSTIYSINYEDKNPELPEKENVKGSIELDREVLLNGLKSVIHASSTSTIKKELNSIYLYTKNKTIYFVATDTFRIAEKRFQTKITNDFEILIPLKNIINITKILESIDNKNINIEVVDKGIFFTSDNSIIYTRSIESSFPDYKSKIINDFNIEFGVMKNDLLNFFKKARFFSNNLNKFEIESSGKNEIKLSMDNEFIGKTEDVIPISNKKGEVKKTKFNYKYIQDSIQQINDDRIFLGFSGSELSPIIIRGYNDTSFTSIVAPLIK